MCNTVFVSGRAVGSWSCFQISSFLKLSLSFFSLYMDGWLGCSRTKWWVLCFFFFQSYSTLPATSKTSHPNESRQNVYVWMSHVCISLSVHVSVTASPTACCSSSCLNDVNGWKRHMTSVIIYYISLLDLFMHCFCHAYWPPHPARCMPCKETTRTRGRSCRHTKTILDFASSSSVWEEVPTSLCGHGENVKTLHRQAQIRNMLMILREFKTKGSCYLNDLYVDRAFTVHTLYLCEVLLLSHTVEYLHAEWRSRGSNRR